MVQGRMLLGTGRQALYIAQELANAPCNNEPTDARVQKTDGKPYEKVEQCRTNLPAASLESLKFGRDPRNPQTFMYDRLIFANKKRRNWQGADLIRGDVHVRQDERLKDELDRDELFLAMTDAKIIGADDKVLQEARFLAVRRAQIVWVMPANDIGEGEEL